MTNAQFPGAGGLTVANQIYNRFKEAGQALNKDDIAIVSSAEFHDYQVSPLAVLGHYVPN